MAHVNLEREFAALERETRSRLVGTAQADGAAPNLKAQADRVAALQAVSAALRAAGVAGTLDETGSALALEVIRGCQGRLRVPR